MAFGPRSPQLFLESARPYFRCERVGETVNPPSFTASPAIPQCNESRAWTRCDAGTSGTPIRCTDRAANGPQRVRCSHGCDRLDGRTASARGRFRAHQWWVFAPANWKCLRSVETSLGFSWMQNGG